MSDQYHDSGRAPRRGDAFARSGLVTVLVLLALLATLAGVWLAHTHGRIHQLTTVTIPPETTVVTRPGGQDVMRLYRNSRGGDMAPELVSAVLLPGRGMQVLQTTLSMPGQGDVPLLTGGAESALATDKPADGANFSVLVAEKQGGTWSSPVEVLEGHASQTQGIDVLPDGSEGKAAFDTSAASARDANLAVTTNISAVLNGRGLELSMVVRNTSGEVRAVCAAWQPRFAAPTVGMGALGIILPTDNVDRDSTSGIIRLDSRSFDTVLQDLKYSYLGGGPSVRLVNLPDGYTLRMTAMSPNIRRLRIQSEKSGSNVLLAFGTAGDGPEHLTVLQPGATLEWRVRLEVLQTPVPRGSDR